MKELETKYSSQITVRRRSAPKSREKRTVHGLLFIYIIGMIMVPSSFVKMRVILMHIKPLEWWPASNKC